MRIGGRYPSDMTDAEWTLLEPLIPAAKHGGRPRKTDMRAAINAILYLLRTGCPWRYLPRDGFLPKGQFVPSFSLRWRPRFCGSPLLRSCSAATIGL